MKKLLLLIILIFLPLSVHADNIVIDERITDVYHINGMMATRTQAQDSLRLIIASTQKDIYNNNKTAMKKETHFDLLYNETYGEFWDKLESFKQKKAEDKYYWLA